MFLLRFCTKYLIQTLAEENVIKNFAARLKTDNKQDCEENGNNVLDSLICGLVATLVDIPLK